MEKYIRKLHVKDSTHTGDINTVCILCLSEEGGHTVYADGQPNKSCVCVFVYGSLAVLSPIPYRGMTVE